MASLSPENRKIIAKKISLMRSLGVSETELAIIQDYWIAQAIELGTGERLILEIAQLPDETQQRVSGFTDAIASQTKLFFIRC